ncbi:hypothetical protein TWF481_003082 [Arthrobotrys musiformis]|uniref:Uncharacterized protein n=1 Tax=Arthrobotrys musiformis TaxID=47236 RepID=A0AAV9VVK8_9PEZI
MRKFRKVFMSHEKVETEDGPRECEIEVVSCTGGREVNLGLHKNKKKKTAGQESQKGTSVQSSSGSSTNGTGKWSSGGSLGGTSSEGSPGKRSPTLGKCEIM